MAVSPNPGLFSMFAGTAFPEKPANFAKLP
jgi:hypothetical protein